MSKTIHKQNSIIRGKINNYDLYTMRCLNAIYYYVQITNQSKETANEFAIPMYKMRETMGMQKIGNYSQIIQTSLYKLLTKITLDENGNEIKEIPFTPQSKKRNSNDEPLEILTELSIIKNHSYVCEFKVSQEFITLVKEIKFNWAEINFLTMGFKSAHTLRFYEYMKSWQGQGFIQLSIDEINDTLFFTSYTQLSRVETIIKRCIKEIATLDNKNQDIEVNYTKDRRRRAIKFTIKTLIDNVGNRVRKKAKNDEEDVDYYMNKIKENRI